jgi:hypothetical protein
MSKWLLLAVVIVAVLWWLGRTRRSPDQQTDQQADRGPDRGTDRAPGSGGVGEAGSAAGKAPPTRAVPEPEPMVDCAHCGVLLPRSDARADDAQNPGPGPGADSAAAFNDRPRYYCCEAHRRAGPSRP